MWYLPSFLFVFILNLYTMPSFTTFLQDLPRKTDRTFFPQALCRYLLWRYMNTKLYLRTTRANSKRSSKVYTRGMLRTHKKEKDCHKDRESSYFPLSMPPPLSHPSPPLSHPPPPLLHSHPPPYSFVFSGENNSDGKPYPSFIPSSPHQFYLPFKRKTFLRTWVFFTSKE